MKLTVRPVFFFYLFATTFSWVCFGWPIGAAVATGILLGSFKVD